MNQVLIRSVVARYDELPMRAGYRVNMNGIEIAVFKLSDGTVRAIGNRSPNPRGGVLSDGLVSGEYIFDAVYDWKISLVDGKVQAPDVGQVRIFPVEVEDGLVYLVVE
jgi:nitrite reductase (NADH) small subunit